MSLSRNLWPAGVIAAFVLFISGTIALVALACSHRNELVSADYYADEVKFQDQLDRVGRAQSQASRASIAYDAVGRRILISLPTEQREASTRGQVQLYRPSEAGLDYQVALELDNAGIQTLDAAALKPGLWKVKVAWTVRGQEYYLDERVVIGRKGS